MFHTPDSYLAESLAEVVEYAASLGLATRKNKMSYRPLCVMDVCFPKNREDEIQERQSKRKHQ